MKNIYWLTCIIFLILSACNLPTTKDKDLLDQRVARDKEQATADIDSLNNRENLDPMVYVHLSVLLLADLGDEVSYDGTYREAIAEAEKEANSLNQHIENLKTSVSITKKFMSLEEDTQDTAYFRLVFSLTNQLEEPLYGVEFGVFTKLEDGTDGYGTTSIGRQNDFSQKPIPPGATREGVSVRVPIEYDHAEDADPVYGMNGVIKSLKSLDVSTWDLDVSDFQTEKGWYFINEE